jgi:hypothetical protein
MSLNILQQPNDFNLNCSNMSLNTIISDSATDFMEGGSGSFDLSPVAMIGGFVFGNTISVPTNLVIPSANFIFLALQAAKGNEAINIGQTFSFVVINDTEFDSPNAITITADDSTIQLNGTVLIPVSKNALVYCFIANLNPAAAGAVVICPIVSA